MTGAAAFIAEARADLDARVARGALTPAEGARLLRDAWHEHDRRRASEDAAAAEVAAAEVAEADAAGRLEVVQARDLAPGDRVTTPLNGSLRFVTLEGSAEVRPSGMIRMTYPEPGLGYVKLYPHTEVVRLRRP